MRLFWYRIMISYLQINHLIQVFYIENLKEISRLYCLKIKTSFSMLNHIKGMKRLIENVRCEQAPTALTCADNKREGHWIFVYRIIVGHANLCIYITNIWLYSRVISHITFPYIKPYSNNHAFMLISLVCWLGGLHHSIKVIKWKFDPCHRLGPIS